MKMVSPSVVFRHIFSLPARLSQDFDHIKKNNKMPAFLWNDNDLEKKAMACRDNGGSSRFRLVCCLLFFFGVFLQDAGECWAGMGSDPVFSAKVSKVLDGDTIEVMSSGKTLRVRLWGIDTPEWQQRFSREAKEFTQRRLAGRRVELRAKTWDTYGRLVALVLVEGHSFNAELVREGLAWVHIYYCKEPICRQWRQLERDAKRAGRGLWQDKNPVAPWKWKQTHSESSR
jgi:endonuclease YncB( thermonuclease family)